jgi:hypothetical protein
LPPSLQEDEVLYASQAEAARAAHRAAWEADLVAKHRTSNMAEEAAAFSAALQVRAAQRAQRAAATWAAPATAAAAVGAAAAETQWAP